MTDELVIELYKLVTGFCKKWNIYSEEKVQDLVWDCYEKLKNFDESKSKLSTFVYMQCRNILYDKTHKHLQPQTDSLDQLVLVGEDLVYKIELMEDASEDKLIKYIYNNVCSDMLKDYLKGYKQKDIAKSYNIPYSTCNQMILRELSKLKEAYGE